MKQTGPPWWIRNWRFPVVDLRWQPTWRVLSRGWPVLALFLGPFTASPVDGAGITGFIQVADPGSRAGLGLAVGIPLFTEIVTLEGEYSRAREEDESPSLTVWSGNILLILPFEVIRLRPYFATGLGVYRQARASESEVSFATLTGLGTFFRLAGPLNGRLEYRVIRLQGDPLQENQKRFYVGLTLRI